ncbi:MAG: hypothetical protein R2741_10990 [Methanolobus sp.]
MLQKSAAGLSRNRNAREVPGLDPEAEGTKREHLKRIVPEQEPEESYIEARPAAVEPGFQEKASTPERVEEVVINDKDTTVIESKSGNEVKDKETRKRKSLDEVMDMDLPDNYEEKILGLVLFCKY